MMYRLIDSDRVADKYPEVNDEPCIYADLPNGLDGKRYHVIEYTSKYFADESQQDVTQDEKA